MSDMTGSCACGAVSWRSAGPVLWAGHCHCESCRRASSSPFTSFFGVPRDGVIWNGERKDYVTSSGEVVRKFCAKCGSQMTYQFSGWPTETHLYAASMSDPTLFEPEAHFHYAEKMPWVEIKDDLPKYPGSANTTKAL